MAVLSSDDFFDRLHGYVGERTDDDSMQFIEDMSDTYNSLYDSNSGEDWERRYNELDEAWKKKYKERFFTAGSSRIPNEQREEVGREDINIGDLFKKQED